MHEVRQSGGKGSTPCCGSPASLSTPHPHPTGGVLILSHFVKYHCVIWVRPFLAQSPPGGVHSDGWWWGETSSTNWNSGQDQSHHNTSHPIPSPQWGGGGGDVLYKLGKWGRPFTWWGHDSWWQRKPGQVTGTKMKADFTIFLSYYSNLCDCERSAPYRASTPPLFTPTPTLSTPPPHQPRCFHLLHYRWMLGSIIYTSAACLNGEGCLTRVAFQIQLPAQSSRTSLIGQAGTVDLWPGLPVTRMWASVPLPTMWIVSHLCEKVRENGASGDNRWWPLCFMHEISIEISSVNFNPS